MDKRKELNKVVRESLSEALIYFMRQKPFSEITITEIITKAGVARATYYRNFDSKEDLAREYISNKALEFAHNHQLDMPVDSYELILYSWRYIENYKDIYKLYAEAGLSDLMLDSMSDMTSYNFDIGKFSNVESLKFAAFIGAFYNVVREWISEGAKVPAEEMAKLFFNIWKNR